MQLCSTSRSLYAVWNECRSVSSSASEKDIDKSSLASKLRPHTELLPIWEDQQFAMLKSLDMSLEFLQPLRSRPWWGWDALQSEECRVSCKEMMRTTRKELKSMLTINMILSLLVQTLVRRCKTILQRHRRYFTKFIHQDKS